MTKTHAFAQTRRQMWCSGHVLGTDGHTACRLIRFDRPVTQTKRRQGGAACPIQSHGDVLRRESGKQGRLTRRDIRLQSHFRHDTAPVVYFVHFFRLDANPFNDFLHHHNRKVNTGNVRHGRIELAERGSHCTDNYDIILFTHFLYLLL